RLQKQWAVPGLDSWVAAEDGEIVGYAELDAAQDVVHAALDPAVGDALLARVEERARERRFGHVACTAVPEDVALYELMQRSGFTLDREIWRMWRPLYGGLPAPVWVGGVSLRTYEDRDAIALHALLDDSYAGWDRDYVARPHNDWLAFMTEHDEFDPGLWFLVERDGELVACALHWQESRGDGWVKDIVVREGERGHGLGTALLHHGFRAYAERGADRVGLKVDSTNPTGAPQLYERLGFVTDQRLEIWEKQL
ncbi:MAG: hypothetical protein QOD52_1635, partial [Gaiellaceae bacterium]|nr:hypothetical protein [Gaiellaceae bacterium]